MLLPKDQRRLLAALARKLRRWNLDERFPDSELARVLGEWCGGFRTIPLSYEERADAAEPYWSGEPNYPAIKKAILLEAKLRRRAEFAMAMLSLREFVRYVRCDDHVTAMISLTREGYELGEQYGTPWGFARVWVSNYGGLISMVSKVGGLLLGKPT